MIPGIFVQRIDWKGIAIEVSYEPDWLCLSASGGPATAHLQIRSVCPERAALPMTETGYRSHFVPPRTVVDHGGPVAYTLAWLEEAERSPAWREQQEVARQFVLL